MAAIGAVESARQASRGQGEGRERAHLLDRAVRVEGLSLAVTVQAKQPQLDFLLQVAYKSLGIDKVFRVGDEEPGQKQGRMPGGTPSGEGRSPPLIALVTTTEPLAR